MSKSWSQVESSEGYKALSGQDKVRAKKQYWDDVVSPKQEFKMLDSVSQSKAKEQFFGGKLIEDLPNDYFKTPNIALMTIGDTLGTMGKSAIGVISGVAQPILHPINTVKSIGMVAKGAVEKMIPGTQVNEKYVDAIGDFYKKRYGSVDGLADTIATDPFGFLTDVAGIGVLASAGLKGVKLSNQTMNAVKNFEKLIKLKIPLVPEVGSLDMTTRPIRQASQAIKSKLQKIDFSTETKIFNDYNSVFPSNKKTIGDIKSAKNNVITAVKAIDENLPEDGIVHPLTGEVFIGKPKNRYEVLLAHDNAKKKIWEKASNLSEGATEKGALIDLPKLVEESAKESIVNFGKIASNTTKKPVAFDILQEAKLIARQGKVTPKQAEEFMKTLYEDSQRLMQSGDFAQYSKKDFYKSLYGKIRASTDDAIEKSLGQSGYSYYRSQYAAVRKAEDAIKAGANKWLKHNQQGAVGSLADLWSVEELLSGNVAKSITVKGTSEILKYLKNPDRKVSSIFKNASKLKIKEKKAVLEPEVIDAIMRMSWQ